jgi:hypothetical protein
VARRFFDALAYRLVNLEEQLAAEALLLGFVAADNSLRGADQDHAAAAFDARDLIDADVNAAARG